MSQAKGKKEKELSIDSSFAFLNIFYLLMIIDESVTKFNNIFLPFLLPKRSRTQVRIFYLTPVPLPF